MSEVAMRMATSGDVDRIIEIVNADLGAEPIALMGSIERAREYGSRLIKLDRIPNPARATVVAETSHGIIGVLQFEFGDRGRPHSRVDVVRLLVSLLGPIGFLRRLSAVRSRSRIDIPIPPGSFHIANLQVDAARQGQGIGNQLLEWAEKEAHRLDAPRMTLITNTDHARTSWYERFGFRTTQTATDPTFERYTGIRGRILMEKDLRADATGSPAAP